MHYDELRHFADSWGLLLMTLFFAGVIVWVMRPSSGSRYRDQAEIPFKHDDKGNGHG